VGALFQHWSFSALLTVLLIGIILAFVKLAKITRNSQSAADADAIAFIVPVLTALMLMALPLAALGGFWLYYFNRPSKKRLFSNLGAESS